MNPTLLIALFGACDVDPAGDSAVDPSDFLVDFTALECARLETCDEHFYSVFDDLAACEAAIGAAVEADCGDAAFDPDAGAACLDELAAADCQAVLTNDLPARQAALDC